jgi:hypothetical protein
MITPSAGASVISSGAACKMLNSKLSKSIASMCVRAYVCNDAVIKPCDVSAVDNFSFKKNAVVENEL